MNANFVQHPSEACLLAQILQQLAEEKHPLLTFLCGDWLEDLFADYPPEQFGRPRLSRGAGRCERLGYLISVYLQAEKFFEEHPECNTRKDNWEFWGNVTNPGYRRYGKMKEYAEKYDYPIHRARNVLVRGGKIKAIQSESGEPAMALLLLPVIHMLDELSYPGARELGLRLSRDSPDWLQAGRSFRKRWEIYVINLKSLLFTDKISMAFLILCYGSLPSRRA
ncbi:hypothetical protein BDV33DRAFT_186003 [Aspergillus novoparasiticus]|uniref:Uncharacterized protein n=1 Tax=Aspergillus novoparasiticus TaxID=986946 RepID=A0A5N6E5M1_9EURO|nr:hypothetical protein BDV33DRAFT_186003 [Aspergillus novoparasiticus]